MQADLTSLVQSEPFQFSKNNDALSADSRTLLDALAARIGATPGATISIEGFTDSSGNDEANRRISQRRADVVRSELIARGVLASLVTAVGRGELDPIASDDTEEGRSQNRRIELRVSLP